MKTWSFIDETGRVTTRRFSGSEKALAANTPKGCRAVEGYLKPDPVENDSVKRLLTLAKIEALERKQPRVLREMALGREGARERLEEIDDKISKLREQL